MNQFQDRRSWRPTPESECQTLIQAEHKNVKDCPKQMQVLTRIRTAHFKSDSRAAWHFSRFAKWIQSSMSAEQQSQNATLFVFGVSLQI